MQTLHVHKRRVSTQDYDRSVVVGVRAETAMPTGKDRLVFAALPVYGSALRTRKRSVCGIDCYERPAALFKLVVKQGGKRPPALIEDAPVEPGFLPHLGSWLHDGAASRGRHIADVQIFEHNGPESFGDMPRCLVVPVAADASTLGGQPRATLDGAQAPSRAFLTPSHDTLGGAVLALNRIKACWDGKHFAGGKRQGVGDAAIDAHGRHVARGRFVLDFAGEGDVPAERVLCDRGVLHDAAQRASVAQLHPTDLGQADSGPFAIEAARLDFTPLEAERVVDVPAARRRELGPPRKEVSECLVKIAQSLLLTGLRDRSNPVEFGPESCEIARLLRVSYPVRPAPRDALFECEVVDETANASELPEQGFLFGARGKLEFEAAMDDQGAGRLSVVADTRSRARRGLAGLRRVRIVYYQFSTQTRGASSPRPSGRGGLRAHEI